MILNLLVLRSDQPEVLVRFYEALGLRFESEKHGHGLEHFTCRTGQAVMEVYPIADGPSTSGTRFGFVVDDLIAACDAAGREGRVIDQISKSERGMYAVVQDPAGHKIELLQRDWSTPGIYRS